MADAAYAVFAKPAREFTGNFLIDDTFLAENGVTDFEPYRVDPTQKLAQDFFVADNAPPGVPSKGHRLSHASCRAAFGGASAADYTRADNSEPIC